MTQDTMGTWYDAHVKSKVVAMVLAAAYTPSFPTVCESDQISTSCSAAVSAHV